MLIANKPYTNQKTDLLVYEYKYRKLTGRTE